MLTAAIATGVLSASASGIDLPSRSPTSRRSSSARLAGVDLPVLRRRVPGEDAGVPVARLDARRLQGDAAAGARGLLGVLSKVAAYGFLRVALPLFPDAAVHFQELLLLIALASILYGSVMAFSTTDAR
jgi:hypothetical protein